MRLLVCLHVLFVFRSDLNIIVCTYCLFSVQINVIICNRLSVALLCYVFFPVLFSVGVCVQFVVYFHSRCFYMPLVYFFSFALDQMFRACCV